MAKIVAIHGIGQQFKGEATIHREWWPSLVDGLNRVNAKLDSPEDLGCAFYGNLFRKSGTLPLPAPTRSRTSARRRRTFSTSFGQPLPLRNLRPCPHPLPMADRWRERRRWYSAR